MFTSGVTLIPTLSCQDKESAVYTTESHDNGIATLTEARCLEGLEARLLTQQQRSAVRQGRRPIGDMGGCGAYIAEKPL